MVAEESFLSRDELLGGMPARRASTLLFAIESRTARLAARDRQGITLYLTPKTAEEHEHAFLEAVAGGRNPAEPEAGTAVVSIQDLELYARDWEVLVPDDTSLCAAIAHLMGQKYAFTQRNVPALRRALALDTLPVQQAYQRLYGKPLSSVYAPEISTPDRVCWAWTALVAKLEGLPPFWTAFLLTLPGQAGLLAMPIALAGIGFSTAAAILVIFGILNMLTAAAMAEAVARSGTTRFGLGFLAQLAGEYLGPAGASLVSIVLSLNNFFVLIVFFLGVAGTLQDVTRLPGILWGALLFGVCFYFIYRRSFNATVGATILIVLINLVITLLIPLLALPHVQPGNLANLRLPFAGVSLQPVIWQLVLGTMLSMYYSHITIVAYAPVVLRRDVGARSWVKGAVAAIFTTMVISLLWLFVANGAVSREVLAKTAGTVITPLAQLAGPLVGALGSVLVVLSLGLSCIQIALVLYFVTNEVIPTRVARWLGERMRFVLAVLPVIAVFLISEWILISGQNSFTSFLGTLSAISLPLFGGMLPVLLLASTRRKGDFAPAAPSRLLGSPLVLGGLYVFFLGSIFLHSLYLWSEPVTRIVAFIVGVAILVTTLMMLRHGMLRPRLVIELRQDETGTGGSCFTVTANGRPAAAQVCLTYARGEVELRAAEGKIADFAALRFITFQFENEPAAKIQLGELKVWAHHFMPEGGSHGIPVTVEVAALDQPAAVRQPAAVGQPAAIEQPVAVEQLAAEHAKANVQSFSDGLGMLPLGSAACEVIITILQPGEAALQAV